MVISSDCCVCYLEAVICSNLLLNLGLLNKISHVSYMTAKFCCLYRLLKQKSNAHAMIFAGAIKAYRQQQLYATVASQTVLRKQKATLLDQFWSVIQTGSQIPDIEYQIMKSLVPALDLFRCVYPQRLTQLQDWDIDSAVRHKMNSDWRHFAKPRGKIQALSGFD